MTAAAPPVALAGELAAAARRLAAAGVASPRVDAELLAAHVLGVSRGRLPLVNDIDVDAAERLRELVEARAQRRPLQHLTGEAPFRHLVLAVGPGVFVPRPETETVVGWVIDELGTTGPARPVCVDLCAGSGAIALALADEVPGAVVHAVEADPVALRYLRRNIAASGLPVEAHAADVLGGPPAGTVGPVGRHPPGWAATPAREALAALAGRVDAVVANPPYLPDADRTALAPEVADFDPPWALWGGGGDGLAAPLAVADLAAFLLGPGGLVAIEHADSHGRPLRERLAATGEWLDVATQRDLAGRDRCVTARRA
ncbi:MAG: peptide chain release factor N(5)-glutamine methyltransferase [Frankia sp.]|nr:peptide chain release factor N(5)-glutamine methyltransferase [Frankia sp.]